MANLEVTNLEIEKVIAADAKCDIRTARRALEHGYMTVRGTALRERLAAALGRNPDLVRQYSKEHYP
jgi:hypothetical protein